MLLGLVAYARSAESSSSEGPSAYSLSATLLKLGYRQVRELPQPGGRSVETFELQSSTRPHYHMTCSIDLTIRDDRVVCLTNHSSYTEQPDQ